MRSGLGSQAAGQGWGQCFPVLTLMGSSLSFSCGETEASRAWRLLHTRPQHR